jgi:hypothetical protein
MAQYRGETYNVPLEQGGFCHNKNVDTIEPVDMVHPSRNIYMNEGGIRKRPGTKRVDVTSMGAVHVTGLYDYMLSNGTQFIVRTTGDGKIWKDVANSLVIYNVGAAAFTGNGVNDLLAGSAAVAEKSFKIQVDSLDGIKESTLEHKGSIDGIRTSALNSGGQPNAIKEYCRKLAGQNYLVGDLFTVNGGSVLAEGEVLKVNDSDSATLGRVEEIKLTELGAGYSTSSGIATATVTGTGTGLTVRVSELYAGYEVDDTFKVDGGDAEGKVLTVSAGAVLTYEITKSGAGYAVQDEVETKTFSEAGTEQLTGIGLKINITALYTGYAEDDTFTVDGGSTLATGKILKVDSKGCVKKYEIVTIGAGYKVEDEIETTPTGGSVGTGFQINISELHDTIKWSDDAGVTWEATLVPMENLPFELNSGFEIAFKDITEHTLGDYWTVVVAIADWATSNKKVSIGQYGEIVFFCNGVNVPTTWDGDAACTANLSRIPVDWKGVSYPKQIVIHGKGNSMRGWALGCIDNPEQIYVSANNEPGNFFNETVLVFNIATGDGHGIVAGAEFGDRIFFFGKKTAFIMEDADYNTDNWGYTQAQWSGGVAHNRLLVKTPNDLVCMMDNGEIYSVITAEQYGDYKAGSLTRASFMNEWIKTHINLTLINDFHAVYDPSTRAILFFMIKTGSTTIDVCLAYFIDRPAAKAWTILDNDNFESGYSANCSALIRASVGNWKIYTGNYAGRVWKLGEANRNDNNNAFEARHKLPIMSFGDERSSKRYDRINIVAIPEGSCDVTIFWYIDGKYIDKKELNFVPTSGEFLGSFILGTSALGGKNLLELSVRIGRIGKRLQIELRNDTANEDFFISQYLIDFIPLGKKVK